MALKNTRGIDMIFPSALKTGDKIGFFLLPVLQHILPHNVFNALKLIYMRKVSHWWRVHSQAALTTTAQAAFNKERMN